MPTIKCANIPAKILDEPTNCKSHSALILLNRELRKLDPINERMMKMKNNFLRAKFNLKWLRSKESQGPIVCAYCGTKVHTKTNTGKSIPGHKLATVDHFIPRFLGGKDFETDNFVIACEMCNSRKGSELWDTNTLKYYIGPLVTAPIESYEIKLRIDFFFPDGFGIFALQLEQDA